MTKTITKIRKNGGVYSSKTCHFHREDFSRVRSEKMAECFDDSNKHT